MEDLFSDTMKTVKKNACFIVKHLIQIYKEI